MTNALAVLTMSCSAACAQAATSLEPGVHIDPGSPAAKEYALPLAQARQTGGGASTGKDSSGALFGTGIKPPGSGGSQRAGNARPGARRLVSGKSVAGSTGTAATVPAAVLRAERSQASSSGDGSTLALLGGGVAILVLGGLGGTVLRRGRHSTSVHPFL
jgi:hypothetical protein